MTPAEAIAEVELMAVEDTDDQELLDSAKKLAKMLKDQLAVNQSLLADIEAAPHEEECRKLNEVRPSSWAPEVPCTCWKSKALTQITNL